MFLINRTPSKLLQNKTPFEILTGTCPDYSQLKTFGCLCYGSTSPKLHHKFLPRSRACIFLGYPSGVKGYKLMDLKSNQVFISRNVQFHEDLFPLKKNSAFQVPEWITPHSESSVTHTTSSSSLFPPSNTHPSPSNTKSSISTSSIPISPSEISKSCVKKVPIHLQDYHCYALASENIHPISSSLSYSKLSSSHTAFISSITQIPIPTSYAEAQDDKEWCDVVDLEFEAMEANNTWDVTSLPKGKKSVDCRLLYSLKFNANGILERRKVRLVAKGYTQKEGLDFNQTFSPIAKMVTIKLLLKISASKRWVLHQLDISNAFLNGDLTEEIYMKLLEGYVERLTKQRDSIPQNATLRLKKSIYGLKHASRQWFKKFF